MFWRKVFKSLCLLVMVLLIAILTSMGFSVSDAYAATILTIEVDNIDDNNPGGGCTLREAIDVVNASLGPGPAGNGCTVSMIGSGTAISYEINLPSYTYTLSGAAGEDGNVRGDLDITAIYDVNINGTGADDTIIDGGEIDRVFHVPSGFGNSVAISNLTVQNGHVTGSNGGGIYISAANLTISNSNISDNTVVGGDGTVYARGGGIYISTANLTISNSTISDNTVVGGDYDDAGGIYVIDSDIVTIDDSIITRNETGGRGGGIFIDWPTGSVTLSNCSVVDNQADSSGGGISNQANLTIMDSTINSNSSGGGGGGVSNRGQLTIANSTVNNNTSESSGGGIVNFSNSEGGILVVSQSTISNNSAKYAGGGVHSSGKQLTLIRTDVQNNHITEGKTSVQSGKGGGVYVKYGALTIQDSSITNNWTGKGNDSSGGDGGGIYADNVTGTIVNSTISDNTAGDGDIGQNGGNGGGVYNNQGILNISNATISRNNAGNNNGNGGGIFNYEGALNITNSTVEENRAGQSTATGYDPVGIGSGGGIYNNRGSISIFDAQIVGNFAGDGVSCDLMNCEAANGGLGGGIYNQGSLAIRNSTISKNRAGNGGDCTGNNCRGSNGGSGGGLYYSGFSGQSLTIESSKFENNYAGDAGSCSGTPCKDVSGGNGGGLYNDHTSQSTTLSFITLQSNHANSGGGIFNQGFLTLTQSIVLSNTSSYGGGVFNEEIGFTTDKGLYIDNSLFSYNVAEYGGGGILNGSAVKGGILEISSSTFSNNSAGDGGAIQNYSPDMNRVDLSITHSRFYGNYAQNDGGAIYNYDGSNDPEVSAILNITNSAFSGNLAGSNGGGIYNHLSWIFDPWYSQYIITPTIINTSFANNVAGQEGGGIYSSGLGHILVNNIFWGNTAGTNGPQIYNSSSTPYIAYCDIQGSGGSGPGWDSSLGTDDGGNIDANPRFVGPAVHDLHLSPSSFVIDVGDNSACPVTDLDGNPRPFGPFCDMGAYEFYPLNIVKDVNNPSPRPGELITFTVRVTNNLTETITNGLVSDNLPDGLNYVGPITLKPPLSGTIGSAPPTLITDLVISPGKQVTVTFPVNISYGLADGTEITNTASVTSKEVSTPIYGRITLVVNNKVYLPLVMK